MKIVKELEIKIPSVPNFIILESKEVYSRKDGPPSIPVGDLSDEQLKEVAALWTSELLRKADEQRSRSGRGSITGRV